MVRARDVLERCGDEVSVEASFEVACPEEHAVGYVEGVEVVVAEAGDVEGVAIGGDAADDCAVDAVILEGPFAIDGGADSPENAAFGGDDEGVAFDGGASDDGIVRGGAFPAVAAEDVDVHGVVIFDGADGEEQAVGGDDGVGADGEGDVVLLDDVAGGFVDEVGVAAVDDEDVFAAGNVCGAEDFKLGVAQVDLPGEGAGGGVDAGDLGVGGGDVDGIADAPGVDDFFAGEEGDLSGPEFAEADFFEVHGAVGGGAGRGWVSTPAAPARRLARRTKRVVDGSCLRRANMRTPCGRAIGFLAVTRSMRGKEALSRPSTGGARVTPLPSPCHLRHWEHLTCGVAGVNSGTKIEERRVKSERGTERKDKG